MSDIEKRLEFLEETTEVLRMQNRVLATALKGLIRALPADIPAEDAAASLEDLAGRLVETHHADPESARDALLHTMACKAAIKGGWKSDERELRVLVDKVQSGEVRFCPHGRPVAVKLTKYELEKMFKRA